MKFVIVFTKPIKGHRNLKQETVHVYKVRDRLRHRWFGYRARRGSWTGVYGSGEAAVFDSVSAARRIIKTAVWCARAQEKGWRASVHIVREARGNLTLIAVEVWPEPQAIDALAAVLHEGEIR